MERVQSIGVKISRVVYRGYHASGSLQEMHNQAIERRTRLRLDGEAESTAQEIENLKLKGQAERMQVKMSMEEEERKHANALLNLDHTEKLQREKREAEERVTALRDENDEKLRYYKSLEGMGVDVTKVLTAPYMTPTETIRIESESAGRAFQNKVIKFRWFHGYLPLWLHNSCINLCFKFHRHQTLLQTDHKFVQGELEQHLDPPTLPTPIHLLFSRPS